MKYIFIILMFTSCKVFKPCDPGNIMSGRSSQHHDGKKMRAGIRVMWIHRDGLVYHVRYMNMKTTESHIYYGKLPSNLIVEGTWVPVDSLCKWDYVGDSAAILGQNRAQK